MATYAKGNKFITKFMVDGKRHTKMHDTKEEGEAWELQARAALKLGKPMPEQPTRVGGVDTGTMQNVLRSATTLHWNQLRRGGQKSVMNAGIFVDWVGPKTSPTDAFKQDKIRDFIRYLLEERGCSPITVNKYISAISILAKFSDVKSVKLPWFKPKEDRARKRYFTPEDEAEVVELLHRWGRERERDFFMFLNDTGLRPWAEAVPLTWDRCRADRVVDIVGKSGKLRDVPLTKRAAPRRCRSCGTASSRASLASTAWSPVQGPDRPRGCRARISGRPEPHGVVHLPAHLRVTPRAGRRGLRPHRQADGQQPGHDREGLRPPRSEAPSGCSQLSGALREWDAPVPCFVLLSG